MALVTGASSGIGAAFARLLPRETHAVLTGRDQERLQRLAVEIAAPGRRVETFAADLATEGGREALIERAQAAQVDLLVCNAGLGWQGAFIDNPRRSERETVAVNVIATVELLHALIPGMLARARRDTRRAGVIVASSMAAFEPQPNIASYAASKSFQLRLVQALAIELEREPIDLLALCPTYTRTEFFARGGLPEPEWAMTPEDVAREGLAALGRRRVQVFDRNLRPHALVQLLAFNPMIVPWRWPRRVLSAVRRRLRTARPAVALVGG
jgi:short-subunit dehydrogenase